jgi:SAM-dependent methyltransferase
MPASGLLNATAGRAARAVDWRPIDTAAPGFSDPRLLSHRPCPICGADRARTVVEYSDFQFFSDSASTPKRADVRDRECLACGAIYMDPVYTAFGYECLLGEAGQSYVGSAGRPEEQARWLQDRGLLARDAAVLDAGCFDGRFLAELGPELRKVGVDLDAPALERARARLAGQRVELVQGDFEQFRVTTVPDVITMFMVLEHLPRPIAVLENLRRIAHPGTALVVEVPILERAASEDVNGFFSVFHTTHFSRHSVRQAFRRAGWAIRESWDSPGYNGLRVLAAPATPASEPVVFDDHAHLLDCLTSWYAAIAMVERRLRAVEKFARIVVWGAGAHTECLHQLTTLFREPARRFALVDGDPLKQGRSWRGLPIGAPASLAGVDWSDTCLVVSSYGHTEPIARAARDLGVPADRIVTLYERVEVC